MSQTQKIKSITINQDRINQIVSKANPMEIAQLAHFAEKAPHLIQIEYEKPKSNVLFMVEKPEMYSIYYFIDGSGIIRKEEWENTIADTMRFNLNNIFLTEANAQKQADRNKLLAEIERFAVENNEAIDWSDLGAKKWFISYDKYNSKWRSDTAYQYKIPCMAIFSSEIIAQQALNKFKDRLDILLD